MRGTTRIGVLGLGAALVLSVALAGSVDATPTNVATTTTAATTTAAATAATAATTTTAATPAGGISPVVGCAALAAMNFLGVPGAPSRISSAALETDTSTGQPLNFCEIKGIIAGTTHFDLKLPPTGWQGQYVQEGCADYCGQVTNSPVPTGGYTCAVADNGQLAVAADDEGHTSDNLVDGSWGKNDFAARVAFGRTSEHSLAQVAKAVIARYYARPPAYSYFDGCSTGGREAMVLAENYPDDFNGIIAGAPVSNLTAVVLFAAWMVDRNTDTAGHQILTAEKIPALHAAVLKACANGDGVIPDPRLCAFDPASIQCPTGTDTANCLTPSQVDAVRAFYRGPTDEHGYSLIGGGQPYGSELGWANNFVEPASDSAAPGDSPEATIALNYLKYLAFEPNPPASYTLADVQFTDAELARLNVLGNAIYNANNPDLRAFAAHGGKLIMYHGWSDQVATPFSTVDYYAAMERTMGGYQASQQFSRLYLVPGALHCLFNQDYTTVNVADFLDAMFDWVQHGTAPGTLSAPTVSIADFSVISTENISPVNALAPVNSPTGSLNAHYRLVPGTYR